MVDDRKASIFAAAFGLIAIGGFWLARPLDRSARVLVLNQWTPASRSGPDGDAATIVRFDLHGVNLDDDRPLAFQIVGGDGFGYALVPSAIPGMLHTFKLLKGYPRRLDSPRLVVSRGGQPLASAALRSLPAPESHSLKQSPPSPVSLVYRGDWGVYAEPGSPIPQNERWWVTLRRTPFIAGLDGTTPVAPAGSHFGHRLAVPYADEAKLVEVDWTRCNFVKESEVVRLDGLRLTHRFGGTTIVVDQPRKIVNHMGAVLLLPRQNNGPRRVLRRGDPRIANVNLVMAPRWSSQAPGDFHQARGPQIEILEPSPEALGLRELRIASQSKMGRETSGPVREGLFSAKIRVTFFRAVPVETRRLVLPVVFGTPIPNQGASFPTGMGLFPFSLQAKRL